VTVAKDSMTFKLFGQDVSLSKTFKGAGGAAGDFEKKAKNHIGGVGKAFGGMAKIAGGVAGGMGLASLGGDLMSFGKNSMAAFEDTAKGAMKMQRYMGGSIEDASRLNHAFAMKGLGVDDVAKSLGIFAKNSSIAGSQMTDYEDKVAMAAQTGKAFKGNLGSMAAAMSQVGVKLRDSNGEIRPMKELLGDAAEEFKNMPEGVDRTALAMKLFGKSGMNMMPFLKEGRDGINKLMTESDKLGTTIGPKDQEAVKKSIVNKRKLGEAVKGLQISFGKNLLPMVEKVISWMTEKLVPALGKVGDWISTKLMPWVSKLASQIGQKLQPVIQNITEWFDKNKDKIKEFADKLMDVGKTIADKVVPAVVTFGGWLVKYQGWLIPVAAGILAIVAAFKLYQLYVTIVSTVTKIWTGIQAAWNAVMLMNPIGLIVLAVIGLIAAIVVAYKRSETFRNIVDGAFKAVLGAVKAVWNWVKQNWPLLLAIITGPIGIAVLLITRNWDKIKDGAKKAVDWVKTKFSALVDFFKSLPAKITSAVSSIWDGFKSGFVSMVNFLIDAWNAIDFGINISIPDWIPVIGGKGINIDDILPDIPRLAMGGIVTSPTLALIGEAGPEAVVPLGRGGIGSTVININPVVMAGTEDVMARAIVKSLNDYQRRGGRLQFLGA
jgi:TP901 family phage tail tape measure protein